MQHFSPPGGSHIIYGPEIRQFFDIIDSGGCVRNLRGMNVLEKLPCTTTGDMGFGVFTSTYYIGIIPDSPDQQAT